MMAQQRFVHQDAGSSHAIHGGENLSHDSQQNRGSEHLASNANMQLFIDAENDEGGREGETYFQEVTQDEGTGGESYNQQNQPNMHGQSSSGSAYVMNHAADRGSVGRAFFGVGGDEQMRYQNHGGGVGDGFDGGYGNAVEEDSGDDS